MNEPLKYNFANLLEIVDDVDKRSHFYRRLTTFLQKKAEIDFTYASSLETLIAKENHSANPSLASQVLFHKLVAVVQQEPKRIRQMAEKIVQAAGELSEQAECAQSRSKKSLEQAQKMSKEILHLKEKLEKLKPRVERKLNELQQVKTEYLSSLLGNQQLQKKNDLYLEVGRLQYALKPLQEDYRTLYSKYSQQVNQLGGRFYLFLQSIEQAELRKVSSLKAVVANYVYLAKLNLDSFLQHYPFLRQEIDTVREKDQFVRNSRESLIIEAQQLNEFALKEADYIDASFDRIERKKNLQELILYGQSTEHKKHLSSLSEAIVGSQQGNLGNLENGVQQRTSLMVSLFKSVFEQESTQDMIKEMQRLFKGDQRLRKDFIFCLQKYRISNEFELRLQNRESISLCLCGFLDACACELDTYNSKMLMLLSVTYHFREGERKVELQELIAQHPIWQNLGWWQSALFETIYEQTRVKVKKEDPTINIWDIKAGGTTRKEEGEEATNQHICFNQLLYFVSNMALFQIRPETIWNYAKKNNLLFKLPEKLARSILNMCPQQGSPSLKHKHASPSNSAS